MIRLRIMGADCYRASQSAIDRLIGAIGSLGIGLEIKAFGDSFCIGSNLRLIAAYYIGHALELIFCSGAAGDSFGLPYLPSRIVETGEVVTALGGIIAIGLLAQLSAASRHRIQAGDILGQLQGKRRAIGRDADIIARCQISCTALYIECLIQCNAGCAGITSKFQPISKSSDRMSRTISIGIADAARAIGAGEFRQCSIARSDRGGLVGIAAVCSHDLDRASLAAVRRSTFRTSRDRVKIRILVQDNRQSVIRRIRQDLDILRGVFLVILATAALELERTALIQMNRGRRVIALEVHALAFHSLELSHVDSIQIL